MCQGLRGAVKDRVERGRRRGTVAGSPEVCGLRAAFRKAGSRMARAEITQESLKQAMKEALSEALTEQRDLFRDVFAEVLEDLALVEAIEEGRRTEKVERGRIFDLLADGS